MQLAVLTVLLPHSPAAGITGPHNCAQLLPRISEFNFLKGSTKSGFTEYFFGLVLVNRTTSKFIHVAENG